MYKETAWLMLYKVEVICKSYYLGSPILYILGFATVQKDNRVWETNSYLSN